MPNYLAFTIGPIYRTMDGARYTRELWASSYLFSYLVKDITRRIRVAIPDGTFIMPAVVDGLDDLFEPVSNRKTHAYGAGLFPDRFILQTPETGQLATLKTILDATLKDLAAQMLATVKIKGATTDSVYDFLNDYLQLYALEMPVESTQNVIQVIMPYLDTLELQRRFPANDESFLRDLFNGVTKSFLVADAFAETDKAGKPKHSFETILEVAARDFAELSDYKAIGARRNGLRPPTPETVSFSEAIKPAAVEPEDAGEPDPVAEESSLITYLERHYAATVTPKPDRIFRPAHKYIAVVQADGDNVGKVIGQLKPEKYEDFSKSLGTFALGAVKEIEQFGGMNIYAGGDDLLFFAPVLRQRETIFDLLVRLDKQFTDAFANLIPDEEPKPTLSFGVSVTYYKFPLYEARQSAATQLFRVAKQTEGKNTIGLRIQKHSGQPFSGAFRIQSNSFGHLRSLLSTSLGEADQPLTSVVHKIRDNEFLLKQIGPDADALQAFFENSFNEAIHRKEAKAFLNVVVKLLNDCFIEYSDDAQKAVDAAYALLRTYGFLTSTELN